MEKEIGRLLERLEERGLDERTIVAIVADHGEEFLEHGRHFHGKTAYGEMMGFAAGIQNGHHLVNNSGTTAVYLEVGSRPDSDQVTYPDVDLRLTKEKGESHFSRNDGIPY